MKSLWRQSYKDRNMQDESISTFGTTLLRLMFVLLFNISNPNSVACVRERTKPTERPLLVGEITANFCG
jgi:hypothetical protein